MTEVQKEVIQIFEKQIADLKKEHDTNYNNQPEITGNRAEIYQKIGENMMKEREYLRQIKQLEDAIADIIGVSPAVAAYIEKPPVESKFEVDAGTAKIDNSLNPMEGKSLNKMP